MVKTIKQKLTAPFTVFALQISVVALIIVSVTAIKFLNGDIFNDLRNWYILNFQDETDVNEVIKPQEAPITEQTNSSNVEVDNLNYLDENSLPIMSVSKSQQNNSVNSLYTPVFNATISSDFGARNNPITHSNEKHKGLDLATEYGKDIFAAADGVVELAQKSSSYGNYLIIDHGNGLKTLYAHCSKLNVSAGDKVKKAQVVAKVGSTGQSTRPHLHFEVILNGKYLNPNWLINW